MDITAILLILALLILVGAYLYAPFLRGYGQRVTAEERELSALLAERERVLATLHDLDFDYSLGKIPEGDYPAQRTSLLQKGADILRKIDAMSAEHPREAAKTHAKELTDSEIESMIAKRRAKHKGAFGGFCPKCGKPVLANDRFCPSCGKALK